jgi:RimJ/RimL family protein N-acetyltransferase
MTEEKSVDKKAGKKEYKISLPIETENLILGDFKWEDLEPLAKITKRMNDFERLQEFPGYFVFIPLVARTEADILPRTEAFLLDSIGHAKRNPRIIYRLAIRLKGSENLIGGISVDMEPQTRFGRKLFGGLKIFIDPDYGCLGYATEATFGFLPEYFQHHQRINAFVQPENGIARTMLEKLGAVHRDFYEKASAAPLLDYVLLHEEYQLEMIRWQREKKKKKNDT